MKRVASLAAVGVMLGVVAATEPIKPPLLPAPVSQPTGEPSAKGDVTPAGGPIPVIPTLPMPVTPAPVEVAPPARPTQPMVLALPPQPVSPPRSGFDLQPPTAAFTVNPSVTAPAIPAPAAFGETPMPTSQLLMSAFLGAALAAAPAPAQASPPLALKGAGTSAGDAKDDVKTQLEQIRNDIKSLQKSFKELSDAVNGTKDGAVGADAGLLSRVKTLELALGTINDSLKRIEAKLPEQKSTSGFGPTTPQPMPSGKGYVRVVNDYGTEMSLRINGTVHRLRPGETKTVEVSPGSYVTELLHAGAQPTTRSVKENETVTLRIH